jgi:hypothetical protein
MSKQKKSVDPIFAAYARTAPLEDLNFYIRHAERFVAERDVPERTLAIVAEMRALAVDLCDVDGTPGLKARVWALLDRYKGSIPGWAGNAGATGSWCEPLDSDRTYRSAQAELVRADVTNEDAVDTVMAEGPVSLAQLEAWHAPEAAKADALNFPRCPRRDVALTPEQVRDMVDAHRVETPEAKPVRQPKRAAAPAPVITCPQCSSPMHRVIAMTGNAWGCGPCAEVWYLHLQRASTAARKPAKAQRQTREIAVKAPPFCVDGMKTCSKCREERPAEEFGSRSDCRPCRQAYRQQRKAAA